MQSIEKSIILWDLDGTLVGNRRSGRELSSHNLFLNSLGYNTTLQPRPYSGLTDFEVLVNTLSMNRILLDDLHLEQLLNDFDEYYFRNFSKFKKLLVPIIDLHELILLNEYVDFGVLTGNSQKRCKAKLDIMGLDNVFNPNLIFFCDGNKSRSNLIQAAFNYISTHLHKKFIIIGDTPNDVLAASSINIPVISIASGNYSVSELRSVNNGLVLEKFHFEKILNYILSV